jgi:hypothetical protein
MAKPSCINSIPAAAAHVAGVKPESEAMAVSYPRSALTSPVTARGYSELGDSAECPQQSSSPPHANAAPRSDLPPCQVKTGGGAPPRNAAMGVSKPPTHEELVARLSRLRGRPPERAAKSSSPTGSTAVARRELDFGAAFESVKTLSPKVRRGEIERLVELWVRSNRFRNPELRMADTKRFMEALLHIPKFTLKEPSGLRTFAATLIVADPASEITTRIDNPTLVQALITDVLDPSRLEEYYKMRLL